jgi:hypothetical protein
VFEGLDIGNDAKSAISDSFLKTIGTSVAVVTQLRDSLTALKKQQIPIPDSKGFVEAINNVREAAANGKAAIESIGKAAVASPDTGALLGWKSALTTLASDAKSLFDSLEQKKLQLPKFETADTSALSDYADQYKQVLLQIEALRSEIVSSGATEGNDEAVVQLIRQLDMLGNAVSETHKA